LRIHSLLFYPPGVAGLLIVVIVALLGAPAAQDTPPEPAVTWANGFVSAEFDRVPADEAVAALARATNVEVRGELQDRREVTAHFEHARFHDVVDRLVGEQNFTITYDAAGNPRRVDLLSAASRSVAPRRILEEFSALIARRPEVDLPPVLSTAFGVPRGRLPWVLRRGMLHQDAAVGAAAASFFARYVDSDQELRAAAMSTDDERLLAQLRAWAGVGLPRVIDAFAAEASDPLLRSKARRLQEQLRRVTPPNPAAPAA
jgi:hypothetical protein